MFVELWWILAGCAVLVGLLLLAVMGVLMARARPAPAAESAPAAATTAKQAKAALDELEELVPTRFRMGLMALATLVLGGLIFWVARQQIAVIVYKASLMTMAAIIGYWADRTAFPHSRPYMFPDPELRWRYEIRRAYIICAAMLTAGLGA